LLRFLLFPVCLFVFADFASFFLLFGCFVCFAGFASFFPFGCFCLFFFRFFIFFSFFVISALPGPQFIWEGGGWGGGWAGNDFLRYFSRSHFWLKMDFFGLPA